MKGVFKFELIRDGKVIAEETIENTVTNEGRNKLLDVCFHNVTQINPWYIGLINGTSASNSNTDTMVSHSGWTEFVGYSESTRQAWVNGSAASQQIASSAAAVFTVNTTGDVQGFFIGSISTKSTTTGTLWSSSLFSSTPVTSGDQVKVTYTLTAN
jgi:hypothetical protein